MHKLLGYHELKQFKYAVCTVRVTILLTYYQRVLIKYGMCFF